MTNYYHSGVALAKKKGKDIHIVETPTGIGDMLPVAAAGTAYPRQLRYRFADVVNVKDYGAVGDGVHDDTAAFEAAAAKGRVFVPRGKYKVTAVVHGNFTGECGSVFTDYKVHVKRTDPVVTRYHKRPIVGIRLIWSELKSYSETRFTPQALAVFDDLVWLRMTPNEENPVDSRGWVGVFDIKTGEKLTIFSTGALNPSQPIDQGIRIFRDLDGKRKLVCRYYTSAQVSDGLALYDISNLPIDSAEITPIAIYQNQNLGYDWFYGDGFYYLQENSAPDAVKYDRSVFSKYDEQFNRVGILCFSASDALRIRNPYAPTEEEQSIADVNTKPQGWAIKDGLIYAVCGAAYGEIAGVASAYQGVKAFSSIGDRVDSALCDPAKCLSKYAEILPDTVTLIEPEGLAVDEYGVMYSLQQTVSNSSMTASDRNFWIFEESSNAVDAEDFSSAAVMDAPVNIERLSIGSFPMIGKGGKTLVNPWTGNAFTSISQVLDYMVLSGQKVFCINCQQATLNDLDETPLASGMLITLELLNSLTIQCSIKHTPTSFLLSNTSLYRYRKENGTWKKLTDRATGIQNAVLGAGVDASKEVLGGIYFPDSARTTLIGALQVQTSAEIKRLTLGGTSSANSPNRTILGIGNSDASYSSLQFAEKSFRPIQDATLALGSASGRWAQMYASSGTINTSDARCKENITAPDDALMRAWGKVGFKVFQFKDAVEKKGGDARIHVGVIAQEVKAAFESEGLDASRYGLFCHDAWEDEYEDVTVVDQPEVTDEDGNITTPEVSHVEKRLVTAAGDRYGIRYEEALALECAYQRWRLAQIEARLS